MKLRSILVYDHDFEAGETDGPLGDLGRKAGFPLLRPDYAEEGNEARLVKEIAAADWLIAFVHVNETTWHKMLNILARDRVLVRASSQGLSECTIESTAPLALRMLPKVATDSISHEDLKNIAAELQKERSVEELRQEIVPESLRGFFRFSRPDFAAAIWIYGIGWLACRIAREKKAGTPASSKEVLDRAVRLLAKAGWFEDLQIVEPVECPQVCSVFSETTRKGISLAEHIKTELGLAHAPGWVAKISASIDRGKDPSLEDMTTALEQLSHELRIATLS
jgi:hypothetical protein